jgi:SAM-dependent methyltransferase
LNINTINRIKDALVRKFPLLNPIRKYLYRFKPYRWKFIAYYRDKGWLCEESASGPGSTLQATTAIRKQLRAVIDDLSVKTMIDVPCGDFAWMKTVNLEGIDYLGIDIVPSLVAANMAAYQRDGVRFECRDLMKDPLPKSDLLLCRDCLFHFPSPYIVKAINNMKNSGATFLLTTTFHTLDSNTEISTPGMFRFINLEKPPYSFPRPLLMIDEGQGNGKSLGLWRLADIGAL